MQEARTRRATEELDRAMRFQHSTHTVSKHTSTPLNAPRASSALRLRRHHHRQSACCQLPRAGPHCHMCNIIAQQHKRIINIISRETIRSYTALAAAPRTRSNMRTRAHSINNADFITVMMHSECAIYTARSKPARARSQTNQSIRTKTALT